MKIGVDIDGVVANFVGQFIPLVKKRFGLTLRERDVYSHDLYLLLGILPEEMPGLVRETIRSDLEPYPGSVAGLNRLKPRHEVTLITARPQELMDVTKDWLSRRKIPYDCLVHSEEGLKYRGEHGFDVFVDDNLREAFGFVGKAPHIVIFDRPWNRSFNLGSLFVRAHSWRRVVSLIEGWDRLRGSGP